VGAEQLTALAAGLRAIANAGPQVATESVADVERISKTSTYAGQSPTGEAWKSKKDGTQALRSAGASVRAYAQGDAVILAVGYPYAFHQGTRPILPELGGGTVPLAIAEAIRAAAARVVARTMGGAR
jgi:hypothetical protein